MDRSPRLVSQPPLSRPRCPWRRGIPALVSRVCLPKDAGGSPGPCPSPTPMMSGAKPASPAALAEQNPTREGPAGGRCHSAPWRGRGRPACLDRGTWGPQGRRPTKGNQKLLQNRKKHRPGLNPGGSRRASRATWALPSLHPPRRPREPLWCLHTAEVCALLQKDPSNPSGLKAARAPAGSPRPEPQCSPL